MLRQPLHRERGGEGDSTPHNFVLDKRRKWMDEHEVRTHCLTLSGRRPLQCVPLDGFFKKISPPLTRSANERTLHTTIALLKGTGSLYILVSSPGGAR